MRFGHGMAGLEEPISRLVEDARRKFPVTCTYLEIGVASGETLCQVAKVISNNPAGWRAVGVERENGYSFVKEQVDQNCGGQHFSVSWLKPHGWSPVMPSWNHVSVVLCDSRDFFQGIWTETINIALIDACHCRDCAIKDFLGVEKFVPTGGVVMFHDYDPNMRDYQQPGHGPVDVFGACSDLGLAAGTREGWGNPRVLIADKTRAGSNMLVVERISDHA